MSIANIFQSACSCVHESDPLRIDVKLELLLWDHIPEKLLGRKVQDISELNKLIYGSGEHDPNVWGEVYLRQTRRFLFASEYSVVPNLKTGSSELALDEKRISKGYEIYSVNPIISKSEDIFHNVAYKCGECSSLVIGKPIVSPDEFGLRNSIPFLGMEGNPSIDYYCGNCGVEMDRFEFYDQTNNPIDDMLRLSRAFQLDNKNPILIRHYRTGEIVR